MGKGHSIKPVEVWLTCVCVVIYLMILIGGVTRLTDSGLSMVEWRPLLGFLPPLTQMEWERIFNLYRLSPEYKLINAGMSLSEFKAIFFWEYLHRVLGRLLGLIYFIPLVYFHVREFFKNEFSHLKIKLWFGLILGGSQGLLGWYMVKSGLVDQPDVSHLRLAAHLSLALAIFCYLFWIRLGLKQQSSKGPLVAFMDRPFKWLATAFIGTLFLQIIYGAMTAGLKAGHIYNTFPKMNDDWFPASGWMLNPAWINLFENPGTIQFIHRVLAITLGLCLVSLFVRFKNIQIDSRPVQLTGTLALLAGLYLAQFTLGVITLLLRVPLPLGVAHQTGGFLLLVAAVYLLRLTFPSLKGRK